MLLFEFLQPAKTYLAVFKPVGLEFAQVVPSYSSVAPVLVGPGVIPAKANAAVCVPASARALSCCIYIITSSPSYQQYLHLPPFKVLEVELYQICPCVGFAGSDATTSMLCPRIFIYSAILTYRYCFC
jgi:hypothetical protein